MKPTPLKNTFKPPLRPLTTVYPDGYNGEVKQSLNTPRFAEKLVRQHRPYLGIVRHIENWTTFGRIVR